MLSTRLGINCIDVEAWLASEPVRTSLDELHARHVEDSVRTYGTLDLPRNIMAALDATMEIARRDAIAAARALITYNNQIIASQLDQIGINTSAIVPPSVPHVTG